MTPCPAGSRVASIRTIVDYHVSEFERELKLMTRKRKHYHHASEWKHSRFLKGATYKAEPVDNLVVGVVLPARRVVSAGRSNTRF